LRDSLAPFVLAGFIAKLMGPRKATDHHVQLLGNASVSQRHKVSVGGEGAAERV